MEESIEQTPTNFKNNSKARLLNSLKNFESGDVELDL
jgi:hypothetical protein